MKDIPLRLQEMMKNPEKFSNNLVNTVANNLAERLIIDMNIPLTMKEHFVNMFIKGSNWQRYQTNKKESENGN